MSDKIKIILVCIIGIPFVVWLMFAYLYSLIELIINEKIFFWIGFWLLLSLISFCITKIKK